MDKLEELFGERFQPAPLMRDLTTSAIGGPARGLVSAFTPDELVEAIRLARREGLPYLVVGGGSNLLVADEGIEHLIIRNEVMGIEALGDQLAVGAGTELQDLVDYTIERGWSGLQRLTGIPGSVGGAIFGNAGAYGKTISDGLLNVSFFDGERVGSLARDEGRFTYRSSAFKELGWTILEVSLRLERADPAILAAEAADVLRQRLVKYPPGLKCAGSFFKNILAAEVSPASLELIPSDRVFYGKIPAGYLLEQVGAKGQVRGDIWVSTASANLFVNRGQGRAIDLLELAAELAGRVWDRYCIRLEPEVQIVGLPSPFAVSRV